MVATWVTALSSSGWAIATRIWPISAVVKVSPSRIAPPSAVSHAPVSSAARNARRSAIAAGIASSTYSSGNTWLSQPTADSETP